jgi:predicted Fe-Mo cluster-binding NifX family protein
MKVAVTSEGKDLDSRVDPRFGRAKYFLLVDSETGAFEAMDNRQNLNAVQGAGIQSAENVSRSGATVLLTGHCGPKAFLALKTAGIKVYTGLGGTVSEALGKFKEGGLKEAAGADVQGHWM